MVSLFWAQVLISRRLSDPLRFVDEGLQLDDSFRTGFCLKRQYIPILSFSGERALSVCIGNELLVSGVLQKISVHRISSSLLTLQERTEGDVAGLKDP